MKVPIARPLFGKEEKEAVLRVLDSGYVAEGAEVELFEREFADYLGASYAGATINGTAALHAALLALDVRPGDEVLTSSFSFVASANAILFCGAEPVFVDIDPRTFNIDPEDLARVLDEHPRAKVVMVVHLFGLPCQMDAIVNLCHSRGVALLEDCAQAHGAEFDGRKVGTFGDAAAFSFYATKNMTTGEGGMVVTNREDVHAKAKKLCNHGRIADYVHDCLGFNYRMTNIMAAIGRAQLKKLDGWNVSRARNAALLDQGLAGLPGLSTPYTPPLCKHVYHLYTVTTRKRDALREWLAGRGVGTSVAYPRGQHQQPAMANPGGRGRQLPSVEKVCGQVISLPVHPALDPAEVERVAAAVREFFGDRAPGAR